MDGTIEKLNQDKQEVLIGLYDLYEQKMYRIAFSILHNIEQAEDATQDAFIKLVPHLDKIGCVESMDTKQLMTNTIKSVAIDRYRKNQKENERVHTGGDDMYQNTSTDRMPLKSVEDRTIIAQILGKLEPMYREIIQFRCFYELSYKEIAAVLEVSEDVAMKRFQRAKKMVQKLMGGNEYEG